MAEKKKNPHEVYPQRRLNNMRGKGKIVWAQDQHTVKFNKEVWEKWTAIKLKIKVKTKNEVAMELMKLW